MTHFMQHGLGDCPLGCGQSESSPDGETPRTGPGDTTTLLPAPVPIGLRVAVKASAYVLVLLIIVGLIGVMVGLVVRIWSWGLAL
jgi:hypothetical protein